MRVAALISGIIGGLADLGGAIFTLFVGGAGGILFASGGSLADEAETLVRLGFLAIAFALLGIIGGAMAIAKPKAAGITMLISAFGGLVAISAGYVVAFILLLVGGILAIAGKRELQKSKNP